MVNVLGVLWKGIGNARVGSTVRAVGFEFESELYNVASLYFLALLW